MSTVAAMGAVAILFIVFGLLRPKGEADCGGGCASCGSVCHRRPTSNEDHHAD